MLVIFLSLGFFYYNNDPATKAAADGMFSRAANTVSSGTRGFSNFAMSGPTVA